MTTPYRSLPVTNTARRFCKDCVWHEHFDRCKYGIPLHPVTGAAWVEEHCIMCVVRNENLDCEHFRPRA